MEDTRIRETIEVIVSFEIRYDRDRPETRGYLVGMALQEIPRKVAGCGTAVGSYAIERTGTRLPTP